MKDEEDMNIKIQNAGAGGASDCKGSCSDLAHYIDHEDKDRQAAGLEPLPYTTPDGDVVTTEEVIAAIDANTKGLSRSADKFFHMVAAPSPEEIQAMGTSDRDVYEGGLKLIKGISDIYAQNFNREGLEDSSGLEIYWKPHFTRGNDGNLQFHIHGIVSRKTKALEGLGGKELKISPLTNHRETSKGAVVGGFDRTAFIQKCEKLFDKLFEYNRKVAETFDYQNAMKHGSVEEKQEQAERIVAEDAEALKASISAGIERRRKNLSNKRELEEIAAMLEKGMSLPIQKHAPLASALDTVDIRNTIFRHFTSAQTLTLLEIKLAGDGITMNIIDEKEGGVADIEFVKTGKKFRAKDIMSGQERVKLLDNWTRLSGQVSAFRLQERRAKKEKQDEVSQRKMGGPKMHR